METIRSTHRAIDRRRFMAGALAAAAVPLAPAGDVLRGAEKGPVAAGKVKLGVVGCGGRGAWIAGLFRRHGGFEMHAVADYFQPVADACGDALGVDRARRFSGLIETFHRSVVEKRFENPTVRRSIDGALSTILAREAALRRGRLTVAELLRESRRLEVDLKGLRD